VDEGTVGGDVLHPDAGAFSVGELCGVLGYGVDRDDGDFAVDAVVIEGEGGGGAGGFADPIGVDAGADGFDDARGLVAVGGGEDGRFEVAVVEEHALGAVEADGFDAEADFIFAGFWEGEFVELKNFRSADLVEADDLYGVGHVESSPELLYLRF